MRVFSDEEKREFEKRRLREEAENPPRKPITQAKPRTNFSVLANRVNRERRTRERS